MEAMSKSKHKIDLSEQLLKAIADSGLNRFQLANRSGVRYSAVHGIVAGTRDPALSTVTKLCRVLGLELRPVGKPKKGR